MSILTLTDVTAVKLYQSVIIAGVGSNLEVYKRDGKFIQRTSVLRGQKVYGIIPSSFESKLLIFGGKQFRILIVKLDLGEDLILEHDTELIVCDDWLHSGVWMSHEKVAVLTAHNVVQIWNIETQSLEKQYACSDNSILYSGLLLPVQDELLVFSGTVFSEVILQWCGDEKPLHYLKGHKGVIFSVSCDLKKQIIVTTSDDRSVRIWQIKTLANYQYTCKKYWAHADIVCAHELYGHSARVMRNCITTDYIISIGEDSGICFWNLEGKLLRKLLSHQNACIWALDANDKYFLTGGGDSSVILHPLSLLTDYCQSDILNIDAGAVKKVEFTARGNIVIMNENNLIYYDINTKTIEVYKLNHKSSYKLLGLSPCKQIIAVVDMTGRLAVYIENCIGDAGINNIMNMELHLGNILSMQWASNRHLVLCNDNGEITVLASKENNVEVFAGYILPICKERWLTSSSLSENKEMLVVSDRNGRVHIYLRGNKMPFKTFDKVHGRYGATSINIYKNLIVTTGRDGTIKYFSIDKCTNVIKYLNSRDVEFRWVEKFLDKNNKYVCGFQERIFVVYDVKNNMKTLEVNCGGGHRSWDAVRYFERVDDNYEEVIKLIYLKNNEIHMKTFHLSKIVSRHIINGTHSKEINCLKIFIPLNDKETVFCMSGGEDTTLRISKLSSDTKYRDEVIFRQLSSIRTLKLLHLEENKILLISAGGRAQLCLKIITFFDNTILSEELVDYLIKGTDKERKCNHNWKDSVIDFDPETRIMDIDVLKMDENGLLVVTGCSDGVLRILKIENISKPDMKLVKEIRHHKTCILKIHTFKFCNKNILATTSTRGEVVFWDIKSDYTDLDIIFVMKTNKSGINSVDVKIISDTQFLLATGGDDNAIHLNVLEIENDDLSSIKLIHHWSGDEFHCSQITGLKLIDDMMVTTSIDQRITLFKLSIETKLNCEFITQCFSDVADIQGIDILSSSKDSIKVCVFGKGIEMLEITCNKTTDT